MIYLLQQCLYPKMNGGCATFLENLCHGLELSGVQHMVVKLGHGRTDRKPRPIGNYAEYYNYNVVQFIEDFKPDDRILLAVPRSFDEDTAFNRAWTALPEQTWMVAHDFRSLGGIEAFPMERRIVIRPGNLGKIGEHYIRHPFRRWCGNVTQEQAETRKPACCHSRIDFDKRVREIYDACPGWIDIYGKPNRMYVHHKMPEGWTCPVFPMEPGSASRLCSEYYLDVDWTKIKGDGGGTQYTSLEAMDAGAIPVIHDDWGKVEFEAIYVNSQEDLRGVIDEVRREKRLCYEDDSARKANYEYLKNHDPAVIAGQYVKLLGGIHQ